MATTVADPTSAGRRLRWIGIALLAVGVVGAIGSVAAGFLAASSATADLPRVEAPGAVTTQLDAGRHSLWVPSKQNLTFFDVVIEGPAGTVEYRNYGLFGSTDAIVDGGVTYRSDGFFEVPVSGTYTVTLTDDGQGRADPVTVIVGPGDGYGVTIFLWSTLGVLVSGLMGLVGLVLLIVGVVRRNRARRAPGPPPGYPPQPGWQSPGPPPGYPPQPGSQPPGWQSPGPAPQPGSQPPGWQSPGPPQQAGWPPPPGAP